eukprot:Sspe_Gene.27360::Locus_11741_Transcript_1_1_Confidence_1.000_Length_725::g.27360::m.27360
MSLRQFLEWPMKYAYRDDEPPDERSRKTIVVYTFVVVFLTTVQAAFTISDRGILMLNLAHACGSLLPIIYIFLTRSLTLLATEGFILVLGFATIQLRDFMTYGELDIWVLTTVQVNILLLCDCRRAAAQCALVISTVYVIFLTIEQYFPSGVYNSLPTMATFDAPAGSCRPPTEVFTSSLAIRLLFLLANFFMTGYFASTMRAERAHMQESVKLAERVAEALVRFDLD